MKRLFFAVLAAGAFLPLGLRAQQPVYVINSWETVSNTNRVLGPAAPNGFPFRAFSILNTVTNNGVINTPPVIDATTFINYGTLAVDTLTVQIGSWLYGLTPLPFETSSTLYYTNHGYMYGVNGFRFDYYPNGTSENPTSQRGWSASFANENPGLIYAADPPARAYYTLGTFSEAVVDASQLRILATNITIGGGTYQDYGASLVVGANGRMDLTGKNVDLSYGSLEVLPVVAEPQGTAISLPPTNFIPDLAISDNYWVQTNFVAPPDPDAYVLGFPFLWNGFAARSPALPYPPAAGIPSTPRPWIPGRTITEPYADWYQDNDYALVMADDYEGSPDWPVWPALPPIVDLPEDPPITRVGAIVLSNVIRGALFVKAPTGFNVSSYITTPFDQLVVPRSPINGRGQAFIVNLFTNIPNSVTGDPNPSGISFLDMMAWSDQARGLSLNLLTGNSYRPANHAVAWASGPQGAPRQGTPPDWIFTELNDSDPFLPLPDRDPMNIIVYDHTTNFWVDAGQYAGYSAFLDNLVSRPDALPWGTVSNVPGNIRITAETLNLNGARIRGEGLIRIDTKHLISSSNAVIDCENVSLDLDSIGGELNIKDLLPGRLVSRLNGNIHAWSAQWSNTVMIVLKNYVFEEETIDDVTVVHAIPTPLLVPLTVNFHALILDATELDTTVPVNVYDFKTHSRDVVLNDAVTIVENLLIDGRSMTLNGTISIPGVYPLNPIGLVVPLSSWRSENAPNLLFFTNNGVLNVANEANFGMDRNSPYSAFVNHGVVTCSGLSLSSDYIEESGTLVANSAALLARFKTAKFDSGSSSANSVADFRGNDIKFRDYRFSANGHVSLNLSSSLSDAGPIAGNTNLFALRNGLTLGVKPATGDLLGTTIQSIIPNPSSPSGPRVLHIWAGEDRGPNVSGYYNNVAVGKLQLTTANSNGVYQFRPAGAQNALYVDLLDMSSLTNFASGGIDVSSGMTLYYAAAAKPSWFPVPQNSKGENQTFEEYINGNPAVGRGRLRWVTNYTGANSSMMVNGQQVNRALAMSQIIDSDNDGTPNFAELTNPTNSNVFQYARLTVQVNGKGSFSPAEYIGANLIVGQTYGLAATPDDGFTFGGWSGNQIAPSSSSRLSFVMRSNLMLTANFNYAPSSTTFSGLFFDPVNGIEWQQSGAFSLKTTTGGRYSGKLFMGKTKYSFSGVASATGAATNTITPKSGTPLVLQLQIGSEQVFGTVGNQAGTWTAVIEGSRAPVNTPLAGRYTIRFPGSDDPDDSTRPHGDGYGLVTVNASGRIKLSGALADGTKVSQSTTASGNGEWPFYLPLYSGLGQAMGWLTIQSEAAEDIGGSVDWIKLANTRAKFYPGGFATEIEATGSRFDPAKQPLTGFTNGTVFLSGGNLATGITNNVTIDSRGRVVWEGASKAKLSLNKSKGSFKGSAISPTTGRKVAFNGVLLQKQGYGSGFFSGTTQCGRVTIVFEP